jgi:hypothetical protein
VSNRPRVYGSSLSLACLERGEGGRVPDDDGYGVVVEDLELVRCAFGSTVGTYSLGNLFVV